MKGSLASDELHDLLSPGKLDWKLGSLDQVERMYLQRAPGLELQYVTHSPTSLPQGNEWLYFEVTGLDKAPWRDVVASGSLAMRISDEMILQREILPGQRTLQIVNGRKSIPLQFALFGVV